MVTYVPDGLVQLCLPPHWSGTNIGDMPAGLRQMQQIYMSVATVSKLSAGEMQL